MKKTIAAFDFDGTIIKDDSLWGFLKFTVKIHKLILGLFLLSPILILYKLKLFSNWKAKQMLFSFFFKGMSLKEFNENCLNFESIITKSINADALNKILVHKEKEDEVLIVSASIENWIIPWAERHNLNIVIATKIDINHEDCLTGKFLTANCYGKEKVRRLIELYPQRNDYVLYAYGDSRGDKELLEFADYSFYQKFN